MDRQTNGWTDRNTGCKTIRAKDVKPEGGNIRSKKERLLNKMYNNNNKLQKFETNRDLVKRHLNIK